MQKHGMVTSFPKLSAEKLANEWTTILSTIFSNWMWVVGIILGFIGWVLHFQALQGKISLVQPLMNIQVVMVVIIGILILHEEISPKEWIALIILITGAVILCISSGETEKAHLNKLRLLIFILAVAIFIGIIISILKNAPAGKIWEILLSVTAGLLFGMNAIFMKAAASAVEQKGMAFNLSSGKTWLAILSAPYFYGVIVAGLSGFGIMQWAFTHGRAAVAVPIFTAVSLIPPVASAVVVFKEKISMVQYLGIVIIIIGAILLS